MKLSERQKEIITEMRDGGKVYKNVTYVTCTMSCDFLISTFHALLNKGLIEHFGKITYMGWEYRLTKLGKTIELL